MPTRVVAGRGSAVALVVALAVVPGGVAHTEPPGLQATTTSLATTVETKRYPVYNPAQRRIGWSNWRVAMVADACCSVAVAATHSGRIIEMGGTFPHFSDDRGRTWSTVVPAVPHAQQLPVAGERVEDGTGSVAVAPDGSIVGIGWDVHGADRLSAYLFDATGGKWLHQEVRLREPLHSRPRVAVVRGPFDLAGQSVPWVSLVVNGTQGSIVAMSPDGLNYVPIQTWAASLGKEYVNRDLVVTREPAMDFVQPHTAAGIAPLAEGGALVFGGDMVCADLMLSKDLRWACYRSPNQVTRIEPRLLVDSRGWLHMMTVGNNVVRYLLSKNGGASWSGTLLRVPGQSAISWDFKVNGRHGLTALAVHMRMANGKDQDMVVRFNTRSGRLVHRDTLFVGNGGWEPPDAITGPPTLAGYLPDSTFVSSVAILPDGRIVTGFVDSEHERPVVAVLV